jgi:hypothetical protein
MHRTIIILPVVLYGCKTRSLTLREECRLGVFENRVMRRIFEPERDKVKGDWRRLHTKELYALHSMPNIIRGIKSRRPRRTGNVACMGEWRGAYRVLVEKPEGRNSLKDAGVGGDNIKMDLREVGWGHGSQ